MVYAELEEKIPEQDHFSMDLFYQLEFDAAISQQDETVKYSFY